MDRQLSLATRRPLTIVTGPPGAGKSVLLADWARSCSDGAVRWLSVEESDDEPGQFWQHLGAALGISFSGNDLAIENQDHLGNEQAVASILRHATEGPPRVLIVDDFHLVTDEAIIESVAHLARQLPAHFRLIVASQRAPGSSLQPLILGGEAVVIGGSDLRFTVEECAALIALVAQKVLPTDEVGTLTRRCEGWAAGLQLAALALLEEDDPSEFIRGFTGAFAPVAQYLEHEMLQRQPYEVVRLLLQTSVLERLTTDLCCAVTGRADAAKILSSLVIDNMFVFPAGRQDAEFRYHRLLADLLKSRLPLEDPPLAVDAHCAAAVYLEQKGDFRSAARQFLEAGAYQRAASLVFPNLVSRSDKSITAELAPTSSSSPGHDNHTDLCLVYAEAAGLMCAQRPVEAASVLRRLAARVAGADDRALWAERAEFLWAVHADAIDDADAVLAHCRAVGTIMTTALRPQLEPFERGGALLTEIDAFIGSQLPVLAARAHVRLGQADEAQAELSRHTRSGHGPDIGRTQILAAIAYRQGRLAQAYRLASDVIESAETQGRAGEPTNFDAQLVLAEVLFEHNELQAARERLEAAIGLCQAPVPPYRLWTAKIELVRVMNALGRREEALRALGHLRQDGLRKPPPRYVLQRLNWVEIDCRVSVGDVEGAWSLVRSVRRDDIPDETLARVELASGQPDRALARLASGHASRPGQEIRRLVLLASTEMQLGRAMRAGDAMRQAVEMGRQEGFVRPFLEGGPPVLGPLRAICATRPDPYLAQLASQVESAYPPSALGGRTTILEPLTAREREVLGYLASHLSGPAIAARIYVSPNTVKCHQKAIFRKLGARSRDEAVNIGASLGLL
ncbi:MAG TPA: LuxR C-terminal-related transcriptional regulator [Acidimicrobiales bacterium]|nr:LuxR C-terminal-related transcriptional regulator [Acidimicrobiales bacterium]